MSGNHSQVCVAGGSVGKSSGRTSRPEDSWTDTTDPVAFTRQTLSDLWIMLLSPYLPLEHGGSGLQLREHTYTLTISPGSVDNSSFQRLFLENIIDSVLKKQSFSLL